MRQPLYKTFGSIKLNPALKAAGWLAGYRRLARVLLRDALCAANDSNRHARPTCCSPAGPRLSPSCCGPSRFLSLLLDFSSRQRQPAGLPGGGSGLCLLLVGPVKCRPGPNNENGPEYKAIPGPENTLPPDCAGGVIQGQGHVLIGRRCPPPAESTIGPSFANM